jgi:serine acetyltransferase
MLKYIIEDWECNQHAKARIVLLLYRIAFASGGSSSKIIRIATLPFRIFYRILVDWLMGIDIPVKTKIGRRPVIYHGFGLVINEGSVIGDDCILRHAVTIGNKLSLDGESRPPIIGDRVEFGAGAIVLGPICVGNDAVIGAGCVVTKDVPAGAVMVGAPARRIN